jgi:hypothetical protein
MRNAHSILIGKPQGRDHLEYLGVDGRIILKCFLVKEWVKLRTGFKYFKKGLAAGFCEHCDERLDATKEWSLLVR